MTRAKTTPKDSDQYGTKIINMTVKAKDGAMVYDDSGNAIPGDQFVTVPVSATLVLAVKAGDLEEQEPAPPTQPDNTLPPEGESRDNNENHRRRREQKTSE